MSTRFSDHLRHAADDVWRAQFDHPFVRGIGDGTLELTRLRRWVLQDYLFLIEYCRLLAFGTARSPDLDTLTRFAELLHSTATFEMDLHRSYAKEFGLNQEDLEAESMAPATRSYTEFLIRTAATGSFGELAAALLPCMWAFSEIGLALAAGPRPQDSRFAAWIDSYSSPEFAQLADWCRALVDRLGDNASEPERRRMEVAFLISSRYELDFWEMAWKG